MIITHLCVKCDHNIIPKWVLNAQNCHSICFASIYSLSSLRRQMCKVALSRFIFLYLFYVRTCIWTLLRMSPQLFNSVNIASGSTRFKQMNTNWQINSFFSQTMESRLSFRNDIALSDSVAVCCWYRQHVSLSVLFSRLSELRILTEQPICVIFYL